MFNKINKYIGRTPRWSRFVGLIEISKLFFFCFGAATQRLYVSVYIFWYIFLSKIVRLSFNTYHKIPPSTATRSHVHSVYIRRIVNTLKSEKERKVRFKMKSYESFGFYELFLVATIFVISIALIYQTLSLSLQYPPIFGVFRQKAFAFYVKKKFIRFLLKYKKPTSIKDDDADKLQPLSSHPLVSTGSTKKPFYFFDCKCVRIVGIWRRLFQYELFNWRYFNIFNGSKKEWAGEHDGLLEIGRIQWAVASIADISRFVPISNGNRGKCNGELRGGRDQVDANHTNEEVANWISR